MRQADVVLQFSGKREHDDILKYDHNQLPKKFILKKYRESDMDFSIFSSILE